MVKSRNPLTLKRWIAPVAALAGAAAIITNLTTIITGIGNACVAVGLCKSATPTIAVRLANLSAKAEGALVYGIPPPDHPEAFHLYDGATFLPYIQRGNSFCLSSAMATDCLSPNPIPSQNGFGEFGYDCETSPFDGSWSPGIPVLDIVGVGSALPLLITQLKIETRLVRIDRTPYVEVASTDDSATIFLINQSSRALRTVTMDYSIVTGQPKQIPDLTIYDKHITLSTSQVNTLSKQPLKLPILTDVLIKYPLARNTPRGSDTPSLITGLPKAGASAVGIIHVSSTEGLSYSSLFMIDIVDGENYGGYGGGTVPIDYTSVVALNAHKNTDIISKDLLVQLLSTSPTIRSQIALVSNDSAIYDIRFTYLGLSVVPVMQSPWIRVQTLISPQFADQYFKRNCG